MTRDDINSLAHSKWNCKYHVVFAPKYRRMVIYNQIKTDIGLHQTTGSTGGFDSHAAPLCAVLI
ncbi:Transposase IS200 like [Ruminococcus sp. YE78]|nr:Transposase IS200 like [Ruminococcus sp. YE78]